jgi:hypothetical protein
MNITGSCGTSGTRKWLTRGLDLSASRHGEVVDIKTSPPRPAASNFFHLAPSIIASDGVVIEILPASSVGLWDWLVIKLRCGISTEIS